MKKYLITISLLLVSVALFSQVAGNINYLNNVHYANSNIDFKFTNNDEIIFEVKGLSNIKADSYVAIFNITQAGKNSEEANRLLDNRIAEIKKFIQTKPKASIYVDMISFVPVYNYVIEKKIFSKKTYNEVPKGFELQKNIHIKYTNPELLGEIIKICSKSEIYDLVKVDYFVNDLEGKKNELVTKAMAIIKNKMGNYQEMMNLNFVDYDKKMIEGFTVKYPTEMYKSFQSYHSTSLNLKRPTKVNVIEKVTKQYYQPIVNKEFDFVVNPSFVEPVVQLMYQIKIKVSPKVEKANEVVKTSTRYILVTPKGDLKNIALIKQ